MYIKGINIPLDVDYDGKHDVIYYTDAAGLAAANALCNNPSAERVQVSRPSEGRSTVQIVEAGDGTGYYLGWLIHQNDQKVWGPKQYVFPIPKTALNDNPNLKQNPGWENGARNDGN